MRSFYTKLEVDLVDCGNLAVENNLNQLGLYYLKVQHPNTHDQIKTYFSMLHGYIQRYVIKG